MRIAKQSKKVDANKAAAALHRLAGIMMPKSLPQPQRPRQFPRPASVDESAEIRALAVAQKQRLASLDDALAAPLLRAPTALSQVTLLEPEPEPSRGPARAVWALIGVVGVLLVATTALATMIAMSQRDRAPADAPAIAAPQPAPAPALAARAAPPRVEPPPLAVAPAAKVEPAPATERVRKRKRRQRRRRDRSGPTTASILASQPVPATPAPASSPEPACDPVACLVDDSLPCCRPTATPTLTAAPAPKLPEMLTAASVTDGLRKYRGRLETCGDTNGFRGTARLQLEIDGAGRVAEVAVLDGDASFRVCVRNHIARARFAKSREGVTIDYPLIIR